MGSTQLRETRRSSYLPSQTLLLLQLCTRLGASLFLFVVQRRLVRSSSERRALCPFVFLAPPPSFHVHAIF